MSSPDGRCADASGGNGARLIVMRLRSGRPSHTAPMRSCGSNGGRSVTRMEPDRQDNRSESVSLAPGTQCVSLSAGEGLDVDERLDDVADSPAPIAGRRNVRAYGEYTTVPSSTVPKAGVDFRAALPHWCASVTYMTDTVRYGNVQSPCRASQ